MAPKKNDSYWHNESLQAIAVMVGLLLVIPSVLRWSEGRWTGAEWAVLMAGATLAGIWLSVLVVRTLRRRRKRGQRGQPTG